MENGSVLDTQVKGITVKIFWQFIIGWTSIVATVLFSYSSLKEQISNQKFDQDRINAIQDLKLDGLRRDNELTDLKQKDINERYTELEQRVQQVEKK